MLPGHHQKCKQVYVTAINNSDRHKSLANLQYVFTLTFCADQRGPTTFCLRAILQKCDNSGATSNKMV